MNDCYITEAEARKIICMIGKRMYDSGFAAANDGNISVRIGQDMIICTPSGVSKGFITEEMLSKVNLKGEVIAGESGPSSEIKMHLKIYETNTEVTAVTHAHPPTATSFAVCGIDLDRPILPEAIVMLGVVPVVPYAEPGTQALADSIAPYCNEYNAVLLANHGAVTWGRTMTEAYHRMEILENYAKVTMNSFYIIGRANELTESQIDELAALRNRMGIKAGGRPRADGGK